MFIDNENHIGTWINLAVERDTQHQAKLLGYYMGHQTRIEMVIIQTYMNEKYRITSLLCKH